MLSRTITILICFYNDFSSRLFQLEFISITYITSSLRESTRFSNLSLLQFRISSLLFIVILSSECPFTLLKSLPMMTCRFLMSLLGHRSMDIYNFSCVHFTLLQNFPPFIVRNFYHRCLYTSHETIYYKTHHKISSFLLSLQYYTSHKLKSH